MAQHGGGGFTIVEEDFGEGSHDRYHRQSLISWWSQDTVASSQVLVVGAGALGNEIVKNLALIGVGSMVIVDLDEVENSNLARCVMFRTGDDGAPKAELLASRAMALNPDIHAFGIRGDIRHDVGLSAFLDADVVIGGLDNQEARLFVDGACWKTTTPWVDGGIEGLMGVVRVFVPPDSPSFESTLSSGDRKAMATRKACTLLTREELETGKVPTTATSASVIGGIQVQEAVKLLHGDNVGTDLAGKGFVFNGMTHDSYVVSYALRGDEMGRDTYDLGELEGIAADITFGELLAIAESRFGNGEMFLTLEREILGAFVCSTCEETEVVNRPITSLSAGSAICPSCCSERRVEIFHNIGPGDLELHSLTAADLGLPPGDVVTSTDGDGRHYFVLGPEESPFHV